MRRTKADLRNSPPICPAAAAAMVRIDRGERGPASVSAGHDRHAGLGRSMEDEYIWGMVPFIQKLPDLSPDFRGDK